MSLRRVPGAVDSESVVVRLRRPGTRSRLACTHASIMQMQSHGWSATCALCELAKHLNLSKRMAHAGDEPCVISVRFASIHLTLGLIGSHSRVALVAMFASVLSIPLREMADGRAGCGYRSVVAGIGTSLPRQVTSVSTAFDTYSVDYIS